MVDISSVGPAPTWSQMHSSDVLASSDIADQPHLEDPVSVANRRFMAALGMQMQLLAKVVEHASTASLDVDDLSAFAETTRQTNVRLLKEMNRRPPKQLAGDPCGHVAGEPTTPNKVQNRTASRGLLRGESNIASAQRESSDHVDSRQGSKERAGSKEKPKLSRSKSSSFFDECRLEDAGNDGPRIGRTSFAMEPSSNDPTRRSLQELVAWKGFDVVVGLIIVCQAIVIGLETSRQTQDDEVGPIFDILDFIFMAIYFVELLIRVLAFGGQVFQSTWVKLDCVLLICAIADKVLMASFGDSPQDLSGMRDKLIMLRLLRLMRLSKLVRLMVRFKVLWLLLIGLVNSVQPLFWTFVILVLLLYVFAVFGCSLIVADPSSGAAFNDAAIDYFGTLPRAGLTLISGLSMDDFADVYRPIVLEKPWMMIYFALYIILISIAVMNLLTALMVETAIEVAAEDKEAQHAWETKRKQRLLGELGELFQQLDEDNSDMVDLQELASAPEDVRMRLLQVLNSNNFASVVDIFHAIDADNSGALTIDEFCEGLSRVVNGTPIELIRIMKQNDDILNSHSSLALGEQRTRTSKAERERSHDV